MVAEYHGEQDDDEYVLAIALDEGRGGLTMAMIATSARTVVDRLTGTERSREDFVERQSAATIVGGRFATVSWKAGNLHVYSGAFDAGKARQQAMFPVRQGDAVALSADGATVAARSSGNAEAGNTIRVWRLADGQEVFSVRLPESLGRSGLQFWPAAGTRRRRQGVPREGDARRCLWPARFEHEPGHVEPGRRQVVRLCERLSRPADRRGLMAIRTLSAAVAIGASLLATSLLTVPPEAPPHPGSTSQRCPGSEIPWGVAVAPDGTALVTQRAGPFVAVHANGRTQVMRADLSKLFAVKKPG